MTKFDAATLLAGNAEFVRKLPGSNGLMKIKVKPLIFSHCRWWNENVQPLINESNKERADEGWDWRKLYVLTKVSSLRFPIYGFSVLGRAKTRQMGENYLPIGMAIVVGNYPYLNDNLKKSNFLWYLSSLPQTLFVKLGFEQYKAVGRGVIDSVLCDAFKNWLLGVVSLHADPAGGDELMDWYKNIGMVRVDNDVEIPKPRGFLKKNDGRYYCYVPMDNVNAYSELMDWRQDHV